MTELQEQISAHFGIADSGVVSKAAGLFQEETMKKGDFYLEAGKMCHQMSFVRSGFFRIYNYYEGREVTQWISAKGYFLTELSSFLFNTPSRFYIECLSDCSLYTITRSDYALLVNEVQGWLDIEKRFIAKCFTMLESRIYSHLALSAEERYLHFFEQNKALFNEVPLQYIASMLGMTPETLSRLRKKLPA